MAFCNLNRILGTDLDNFLLFIVDISNFMSLPVQLLIFLFVDKLLQALKKNNNYEIIIEV